MRWWNGRLAGGVRDSPRAMREPVTTVYDYKEFWVRLKRGNRVVNYGGVRHNSINFRMKRTSSGDQFEPTPSVQWTTAAVEPVPSGFGLQIWAPDDVATKMSLHDLTIKLLK
jgi:hypothetical protein